MFGPVPWGRCPLICVTPTTRAPLISAMGPTTSHPTTIRFRRRGSDIFPMNSPIVAGTVGAVQVTRRDDDDR
jgi:hypothetical protein